MIAATGAVLAAVTRRSMADNSRALDLQHRFEAAAVPRTVAEGSPDLLPWRRG